MNTDNSQWDLETDVVVLGSGAAALTAAIAAHDFGASSVAILEKSGMVGGTSAMSGGVLWIPNNHHQQQAGVKDSWDDAVAYLNALDPDTLDPDTLAAFLETGPEMVRYMEDHTPVRFHLFEHFPDYHPNAAGALPYGGRSLDNDVFAFSELGSWATRVNPPKSGAPLPISMTEARNPGQLSPELLKQRVERDCRGQGQALIGALLKGVLDRKLAIHFETRARELCGDGTRVTGVLADQGGRRLRVHARRGVVLATGGYEWNKEMVGTFLRGPMTAPISTPENEGDGLVMAIKAGAKLGNMGNAWWMISTLVGEAQHRDAKPVYSLCLAERTMPGSILVNRAGKRFVNEATGYNALGRVLHTFDANTFDYANLPCWLIFDHRFRSKYPIFGTAPGATPPFPLLSADSPAALAEKIGIDGDALTRTIARFNADVAKGHDDEFERGSNTYDNFWGDQSFNAPYCTLGTLDQAPYYAVRMEAGTLGTNGGAKTNGKAQVLDWENNVIEGLYAAGNVMSAPTTRVYGGAGGTLGPAMTFGFIAGRHAASGN